MDNKYFERDMGPSYLWNFDKARDHLITIQRQDGTDEVHRRGIIVASDVSLEIYLKFCEGEPKVNVKHRFIDGKIIAYEVFLNPHEVVKTKLLSIMKNWSQDEFLSQVELDVIADTRKICRPDASIQPLNRQQPLPGQAVNATGQPYPTMVVEIGNTESLYSLHELAALYFSPRTNIQLYLAIKLFPRRQNQDRTFALLAMLYRRDQPNPTIPSTVISFGTTDPHVSVTRFLSTVVNFPANNITGVGFGQVDCCIPNLPDYQLAIPTNLLFDGVPTGAPFGTPNNFYIDLWKIQRAFFRTT